MKKNLLTIIIMSVIITTFYSCSNIEEDLNLKTQELELTKENLISDKNFIKINDLISKKSYSLMEKLRNHTQLEKDNQINEMIFLAE